MGIIDKSIIEKCILPHLIIGTRGYETTGPLMEIVECISIALKRVANGVSYLQNSSLRTKC